VTLYKLVTFTHALYTIKEVTPKNYVSTHLLPFTPVIKRGMALIYVAIYDERDEHYQINILLMLLLCWLKSSKAECKVRFVS